MPPSLAQRLRLWVKHIKLASRLIGAAPQALWTLRRRDESLSDVAAKVRRALRAQGTRAITSRLAMSAGLVHRDPDAEEVTRIRRELSSLAHKPLISIVMPTYNTRADWLRRAVGSVTAQLYPHWELCIADDASTDPSVVKVIEKFVRNDARIRLTLRSANGGIAAASNSALAMATGEFVALLDHDDELAPDALYHVAREINAHPDVELIYSDEDKIDLQGLRCDPYFKSDWNYDLFLSHNLITHLAVYRTARLRALGGFREGFDGAQDYDLALRCIAGLPKSRIRHIPRLLYHWRKHPDSTAHSPAAKSHAPDAARRAIADHLRQRGIDAEVLPAPQAPQCHRVKYALPPAAPRVTIVIPTRNGLELLEPCVDSIRSRTGYRNFDLLIVDNGSDDPGTQAYLRELARSGQAEVVCDPRPFNFSALVNEGVRHASGEIIALLNNDVEVLDGDWLGEMVSHAVRPEIGIVGARLWFPDFTLQHAGVILGIGGVAGHAHKQLPKGLPGYAHRAVLIQDFSAVTAACMGMRKSVFDEVGGFDEALAVAFNDVDFCLRVRARGYQILWTPYAELLHHESATRGYEVSPEKRERYDREHAFMRARWGDALLADPAYNRNLTLDRTDFTIAWPPRTLVPAL